MALQVDKSWSDELDAFLVDAESYFGPSDGFSPVPSMLDAADTSESADAAPSPFASFQSKLIPLPTAYAAVRSALLESLKLTSTSLGVELVTSSDGLLVRVTQPASFVELLRKASKHASARKTAWALQDQSSVEKAARRIGLAKSKSNWIVRCVSNPSRPVSTVPSKRAKTDATPLEALRCDVESLSRRVDQLEASLKTSSRVVVPDLTDGRGRDIAYWYRVHPDADAITTGDVVFIDDNLLLSKSRPGRPCVCGVVVDPRMPWAHVGMPAAAALATGQFRPVCVKGQVPVTTVTWKSWWGSKVAAAGDFLVPDPEGSGAAAPLPFYRASDAVIGQVVSVGVGKGESVRVVAHVHMPAVTVGVRLHEPFARAAWRETASAIQLLASWLPIVLVVAAAVALTQCSSAPTERSAAQWSPLPSAPGTLTISTSASRDVTTVPWQQSLLEWVSTVGVVDADGLAAPYARVPSVATDDGGGQGAGSGVWDGIDSRPPRPSAAVAVVVQGVCE